VGCFSLRVCQLPALACVQVYLFVFVTHASRTGLRVLSLWWEDALCSLWSATDVRLVAVCEVLLAAVAGAVSVAASVSGLAPLVTVLFAAPWSGAGVLVTVTVLPAVA
jgi:hypothetical protein